MNEDTDLSWLAGEVQKVRAEELAPKTIKVPVMKKPVIDNDSEKPLADWERELLVEQPIMPIGFDVAGQPGQVIANVNGSTPQWYNMPNQSVDEMYNTIGTAQYPHATQTTKAEKEFRRANKQATVAITSVIKQIDDLIDDEFPIKPGVMGSIIESNELRILQVHLGDCKAAIAGTAFKQPAMQPAAPTGKPVVSVSSLRDVMPGNEQKFVNDVVANLQGIYGNGSHRGRYFPMKEGLNQPDDIKQMISWQVFAVLEMLGLNVSNLDTAAPMPGQPRPTIAPRKTAKGKPIEVQPVPEVGDPF